MFSYGVNKHHTKESTMSGLDYDPRKNQGNQDGRESNFARMMSAPQAAEHLDSEATLFAVKPSQNVRPYFLEFRDYDAVKEIKFGSKATFKLDGDGWGPVIGVEAVIELPVIGDSDSTAAAPHPDDASYGGSGTDLAWQPSVGELILGGLNGAVTWRHGTEIIKRVTPEEIRAKRLLSFDNEGTAKRTVYDNGVLRVKQKTNAKRYLIVPLWCPWSPDSIEYGQMLPLDAIGQPTTVEIDIPRLTELVQTDIAASKLRVVNDGAFDTNGVIQNFFLRVHHAVLTMAERNAHAEISMQPGGLRYKVMHSLTEQKQLTTTKTAHTVKVKIQRSVNPIVKIVAFVRMAEDAEAVGTTGAVNDARAVPRSIGGVVQRPDWTRWLPINAWYLTDNGTRITPVKSSGYYNNSTIGGHCALFKSTPPGSNVAVHSFSVAPWEERHGLGQFNATACKQLELNLELPEIDASVETSSATDREIVVMTFERNHYYLEAGQQGNDYCGI